MLGEIRGEVRFKEPLSFHTSLRIGGPADIFVVPQDVEDIRLALSLRGAGAAARSTSSAAATTCWCATAASAAWCSSSRAASGRAEFHGEEAVAGAGVSLSALIREAAALNLGGIECLVGIPATIGGAVAMNAGTPDGGIGDFVSAVYFLHPDGTLGEFKPGAGGASATACFAAPPGRGADRRAAAAAPAAATPRSRRTSSSGSSRRSRPSRWRWPRSGCVWKNPPGETAARLIEKVGLKGKRLNGAEISAKHANFIVNRGRRHRRRHQGPHGAHPRARAQTTSASRSSPR